MHSRKKYALIAAACVVVIGAALLIYGALGRKPFRGLEPGEIVTASVTLTPPDVTVTEVTAFNPFLIIDGTAYKTKYAPVVVASCISSLPAKAESSVIPLLLLSHEVHSALRGFPAADGDRPQLSAFGGQFDARFVVASCISFAPG